MQLKKQVECEFEKKNSPRMIFAWRRWIGIKTPDDYQWDQADRYVSVLGGLWYLKETGESHIKNIIRSSFIFLILLMYILAKTTSSAHPDSETISIINVSNRKVINGAVKQVDISLSNPFHLYCFLAQLMNTSKYLWFLLPPPNVLHSIHHQILLVLSSNCNKTWSFSTTCSSPCPG